MITDEEIVSYFVDKTRNAIISAKINYKNLSTKKPEYKDYLENRFPDAEFDEKKGHINYCSVVARICRKIETRPTCKVCGKPLKYMGFKKPYGVWCDCKCQLSDREFISWREGNITKESREKSAKKARATKLEKYGSENYNNREKYLNTLNSRTPEQKEESKNKRIKTCLEKYGVKYAVLTEKSLSRGRSKEAREKQAQGTRKTMFERYGGYTMQSPTLREKVEKTNLERHGDPHWINREKARDTLKKRTGFENPYQIPEIRSRLDYNKVIETKKKKGTLNSSSTEKLLYSILLEIFDEHDIITQYRDDRYTNPDTNNKYVCDFYVVSKDLFIEYQGSQYHHDHPFDPESEEDIKELDRLYKERDRIHEEKNVEICQIDNIIFDWTKRDPLKRKVAKDSNLLYLEIWEQKEGLSVERVRELIKSIVELDD